MSKYFMTSVADVRLYDSSDVLVATAKTLMDSSIDVSVAETEVRGGKGNALQYVLSAGADLSLTLSETQFSLDFLEQTLGATLATGVNIFSEETITLDASKEGTVAGTPLAYQNTAIYAWITHVATDTVERVVFAGSTFTSAVGVEDDVVCVRYYNLDAAAKQITIGANVIPNIVRAELETQLADSTSSTNVVGSVRFTVPSLKLSGAFTMSMSPDGVSETPLTGKALAYSPTSGSCTGVDVLGYITRVIDSALWYSDVVAMALIGGDLALTHQGAATVVAKAIHDDGSVSTPPVADLTFSSTETGFATIGAQTGIIATVAPGVTIISCTITSKTSIDAALTLTVSAP